MLLLSPLRCFKGPAWAWFMGELRMGRLLLKYMNVQYKIHLERARSLTRAGGGVGGVREEGGNDERRGHQCFLSGRLLWHHFKQSLALSLSLSVPTLVIVQSQLDCNWSFFSFMGLSLPIYTPHHCSLKLHITNVSIRQVPERLSSSTRPERCGVGRSHS